MSVDKMSVDKMRVDKMSIDSTLWIVLGQIHPGLMLSML